MILGCCPYLWLVSSASSSSASSSSARRTTSYRIEIHDNNFNVRNDYVGWMINKDPVKDVFASLSLEHDTKGRNGDEKMYDVYATRMPRGGGGGVYYDDYDYDEYDDDDDEEDYDEYDDDDEVYDNEDEYEYDDEYDYKDERYPRRMSNPRAHTPSSSSSSSSHRIQQQRRRRGTNNALASITSTTKTIGSKTAGLAVSTVRESTKVAMNLASPKRVQLRHVAGMWRFDQVVSYAKGKGRREGDEILCAANIEMDARGKCFTTYEGKKVDSEYNFIERAWPRFCTIEFTAKAFQGPHDKEPVAMFYKGHFTRKVMDRSVIKIEGKIYALRGRGMFQKKVCVGTFVARKRLGRIAKNEPNIEILDQQKASSKDKNEAPADDQYDLYDEYESYEYED